MFFDLAADVRFIGLDFAAFLAAHLRGLVGFIASRMRWSMNHAVFWVTPMLR